jgi:hypothetical protein
MKPHLLAAAALIAVVHHSAGAQGASDLAKASQNPIGDLVSLPFQFNFNGGGGLTDGRSILNVNFQPVLPLAIGENWNVVVRTIVPYLSIPGPGLTRFTGFGDVQQQLFFTPAHPGGLIWGVGPVFSFPTATNELATTGSWAVGPGVVLLKMAGSFVLGVVAFNVWTFADNDHVQPEVNSLTFQPFINYNMADGWALGFSPIITANWDAPDGEEWTVPLGLGITKVTAIGSRPVSLGIFYYNNVERPAGATKTQIKFAVSLLFPKGRK